MSIDATTLGILAAQVMQDVSEQFGDECYVRTAAVPVEVDAGPETHILVATTDDRPWAQVAFLKEGVRTLENLRYDAEVGDE